MRFLFVDRIVQQTPGEQIKGIKHVSLDDDFLCLDDQGRACFIPTLIGEILGQLAAWNVMNFNQFTGRPVAGIAASAELHRSVYVGETLLLESNIQRLDETAVEYNSVAHVNDEKVFSIEGALGPILPMEDFIDPQLARMQYSEIHRPGDWNQIKNSSKSSIDSDIKPKNLLFNTPFVFDCIHEFEPAEHIIAEKRITRAAGYFDDHFPRKPVLPMTALLECKVNLAKTFLKQSHFSVDYHFRKMSRIKMNEFVYPGDILMTQAKIKKLSDEELVLSFRSTVEGKRVCIAEAVFTARG